MSPQSSRYPDPVSGDDTDAGGRHRRPDKLTGARPESLADVVVPRSARAFQLGPFDDGFIEHGFLAPAPAPRAARRSAGRAPRRRGTTPGRHSAAAADIRPPVTGIHRAPGTLPIETLLRVGKGRQQVLLASLIAVGLLVVAVPAQQRREGVHAVNSAAQRVIGGTPSGTQSSKYSAAEPSSTKTNKKNAEPAAPEATPTAPAGPAKKPATANPIATSLGHGPGHSLRTTGTAAIALTFDDGPDPVQTPKILALLAKYQITATFCLVGQQVEKHPEIVRQIVAAGHTLCNHTWDHSLTIGKDKPEQIQQDLARTNAAIRAAVPDAKIPFFRAPGGNFTDTLVAVAADDGMASLYWEVDPRDWDHPTGEDDVKHVDKVIAGVRAHVRPGSIVLSHDFNQPDTIEAYEQLLPWLKANFRIGLPGGAVPAPTTAPTVSPEPTPTTSAPATSPPAAAASPSPSVSASPSATP